MKRYPMTIGGLLLWAGVMLSGGCVKIPVPPYPWWGSYGSEAGTIRVAREWSQKLDRYIRDWMDGRVPAEIPAELIPEVQRKDPMYAHFRLVRPGEITPEQQWVTRLAQGSIDPNASYGEFWDPHATYGLLSYMMIPFGHKVIIEGEFPHCRYFSLQVTHAFDPKVYAVEAFGAGEVA
ncbi:MAG: hypothetical protein D6820_02475, partial [Lentisphaerae bacterium]